MWWDHKFLLEVSVPQVLKATFSGEILADFYFFSTQL